MHIFVSVRFTFAFYDAFYYPDIQYNDTQPENTQNVIREASYLVTTLMDANDDGIFDDFANQKLPLSCNIKHADIYYDSR